MPVPTEPVIVAEQGCLVIAGHGANVLVFDRGNGPTQILAFVLVVIALVFGGFGAVSLMLSVTGDTAGPAAALGVALLLVGVAAAAGTVLAAKAIRRRRDAPLSSMRPVAVFDRHQRVYRDGSGQAVAPLDQVRFERAMQLTSSSPKLVAVTPSGTHVLKRGNPFGGGIGNLHEVLTAVVHAR